MNKDLRSALQDLENGAITFTTFARRTTHHWERNAKIMQNRWKVLPLGIETADITQVILLGVWQALRKYDATKGAFPSWAAWYAITRGQKWIHKQRGACRGDGKAPSRIPVTESVWQERFSGFANEADIPTLENTLCVSDRVDDLERAMQIREASRKLAFESADLKSLYADAALRRSGFDEHLAVSILFADRSIAPGLKDAQLIISDFAATLAPRLTARC